MVACMRCSPLQSPPAARLAEGRRAGQRRGCTLSIRAAARTIELDGAVVVAPEKRKPKGIVHFLGGAFVGATPHLTYSLLLERLADGGYTCVSTPYAVTFRHVDCAQAVHARFEAAVAQLRSGGGGGGGRQQGAWAVPAGLPVHGVGHSNGALLHMLIGAVCLPPQPAAAGASSSGGGGGASGGGGNSGAGSAARASNVLLSYNNLQVGTAIPVPLGMLLPAVQQLRGQGRLESAAQDGLRQAAAAAQQLLTLSGDAVAAAAGPANAAAWRQQQQQLLSGLQRWDPALVQLGSVFDEVGDGFQDFSPTPTEARQLIGSRYSVPSTLLVQFQDDGIDQSPEAASFLGSRQSMQGTQGVAAAAAGSRGGADFGTTGGNSSGSGGGSRDVRLLVLPGSHVTPCGGDLTWQRQPGAGFGPADALAMAAKAVLQADTNRLADRVLEYLDAQSA